MAVKNYYVILGVSRSESLAGIRARYRDLARTFHPDVAGAQSTGAFQEITEAYKVLGDPVARRRYNDELAEVEGRPPVEPGAEPFTPRRWEPSSLFAGPQTIRPSLEAVIERVFRNFTGSGIPKSERLEGLNFEVILTRDEAVRGVEVPVGLPRVHRCPDCDGTGRIWLFPCLSCGEQGLIESEEVVRIRIPPLVHPRSIIEVPVHRLGIQNLYLRLHVRIE
jgi:molecular chaperone DnaJ